MDNRRIQALRDKLCKAKTDVLLITNTTSIDYLIGHRFHPGERFLGLLVFAQKQPVLMLNKLFPYDPNDNIKTEHSINILSFVDGDDVIALLLHHCTGQVAVDNLLPANILLPFLERSRGKIDEIMLGSHFIDGLRLIKSSEEQDKMRAASMQNDAIMKEVESFLQLGVSDLEVEKKINAIHQRLGVTPSFPPIVAFQKIASDPHGSANGQILQRDDCVIIDMGIILDGYCSDMTRTFLFGETEMRNIYDIVLRANKAAIDAIRPGVRFCDVDAAARSVIEQAGYGEYFTHRTGHGIGMEVHEPMDVSAVNQAVLESGMCFSIEPGIYLPGIGGVRIEDLVIVSDSGAEVLNSYPK